MQVEIIGWLRP